MAALLKRYVAPLLFGALVLYPIYFALSTGMDTLWGEQRLLTWFLFDSRHALATRVLEDWRLSAPIAAAYTLAGLLPLLIIARRRALPPLLGLTLAAAVIAAFLHFAPLQILLLALSALLTALFVLLLARGFGHGRA